MFLTKTTFCAHEEEPSIRESTALEEEGIVYENLLERYGLRVERLQSERILIDYPRFFSIAMAARTNPPLALSRARACCTLTPARLMTKAVFTWPPDFSSN